MQPPRVHIIGAGLSGLSAAVALAESSAQVLVHEATGHAGGRCRSYLDPQLGLTIDNGNHLILSGNRSALAFLDRIGASDRMQGPASADFPFADVRNGLHWRLRPGKGRLPFWLLSPRRRPPGTRLRDWLAFARLPHVRREAVLGDVMACEGAFYERVAQPILVSALNTDPKTASALLTGAVLRETLALGGNACRPMIARTSLDDAFIDPALAYLAERHVPVQFEQRLRRIVSSGERAVALDFGAFTVPLSSQDMVIVSVPGAAAEALVPGTTAPDTYHPILNVHFAGPPPKGLEPFTGIIGGTAEWIFAYADRISSTTSAADRLDSVPADELARAVWRDVRAIAEVPDDMPPFRVLREKRATFAATPEQNRRRPPSRTAWPNVLLAGDWTATGLPATIEGAIRSGETAAQIVRTKLKALRRAPAPSTAERAAARPAP
jgi:squalene-associated FAD-dependent desaturase